LPRYEDTERVKSQNPETVLLHIGLQPGFTFMDIGCGDGFFSIPAAKIVGKEGKVFGLDANSSIIDSLQKKAQQEGLNNIVLKAGKAEEIILCDSCADIVFFSMALHDFATPLKALGNAHKMLRPGGKLVNLDWKKIPMECGAPLHIRFSEIQAQEMIEQSGFKVASVEESGPYHYLITAHPA